MIIKVLTFLRDTTRAQKLNAAAVMLPILIAFAAHLIVRSQFDTEQAQNARLVGEIAATEKQLKEVSDIVSRIETVYSRLDIAREFKASAYTSPLILAELSRLPRTISVRRVNLERNRLTVDGDAIDLLAVGLAADRLRLMEEITEVIVGSAELATGGTYSFTLNANLSRSEEGTP